MTNNTIARLACEPCRERKVKCDRISPKCGLCARLGYPCAYRDRVSNRVRQNIVIQQLQERVRQAEAKLTVRSSSSSPSNSSKGSSTPISYQGIASEERIVASPTATPFHPPPSSGNSYGLLSSSTLASLQTQQLAQLDPTYGIFGVSASGSDNGNGSSFVAPSSSVATALPDDFSFDLDMKTPVPTTLGETNQLPMGSNISTSWSTSSRVSSTPLSPSGSPTSDDLSHLHEIFFNDFNLALPIVAKESFSNRLAESPESLSIQSVSYSIALLATLVSNQYCHLEKSCYTLARQYVDACESDDLFDSLASIGVLQALLCLTRFDLSKRNCARAYITLGRAARLASMMRLDQMDRVMGNAKIVEEVPAAPQIKLHSTHDLLELEERRRCFWALYVLEGYVSLYTSIIRGPSHATLLLFLPSMGSLGSTFEPQSMPYIHEAVARGAPNISPFAGLVLIVYLINQLLEHVEQTNQCTPGFWDRHYDLVKMTEAHGALLKPLFALRNLYSDAVSLDVQLAFCGVEMILYRTALDWGEQRGVSNITMSDVEKRLLGAALTVASTIHSTWAHQQQNVDKLSLSGAFIAWPLSLAIQVLTQNILGETKDCAQHLLMLYRSLGDVETPGGPWHQLVDRFDGK